MENIRLNFFPLVRQDAEFHVYRKEVLDTSQAKDVNAYRTKLPKVLGAQEDWLAHDILLSEKEGFEKFTCDIGLNHHLAEYYIFDVLKNAVHAAWSLCQYQVAESSKYREIRFQVKEHPAKGNTEIIVSPYSLKSQKKVGFLLKHHFHALNESEFDRETQILSLSLDKTGRPNVFNYRDEELIIKKFFDDSFKVFLEGNTNLTMERDFISIQSRELSKKLYLVGGGAVSPSQFMGIKNSGPYRSMSDMSTPTEN